MVGIQLFVTTKITSLMDSDRSYVNSPHTSMLSLGSFFLKELAMHADVRGSCSICQSLSLSHTHTPPVHWDMFF